MWIPRLRELRFTNLPPSFCKRDCLNCQGHDFYMGLSPNTATAEISVFLPICLENFLLILPYSLKNFQAKLHKHPKNFTRNSVWRQSHLDKIGLPFFPWYAIFLIQSEHQSIILELQTLIFLSFLTERREKSLIGGNGENIAVFRDKGFLAAPRNNKNAAFRNSEKQNFLKKTCKFMLKRAFTRQSPYVRKTQSRSRGIHIMRVEDCNILLTHPYN